MINSLRNSPAETVVVEFGDFSPGEGGLDRARTHTYLKSLEKIGYDAVSIHSELLSAGRGFSDEAIGGVSPPLVSLNAVDAETGEPVGRPFVIKDTGRLKVAIAGLTDPPDEGKGGTDRSNPDDGTSGMDSARSVRIVDPLEAVEKHLPAMIAGSDVIILMSSLSPERNAEIAERFPGIAVILGTGHVHGAEETDPRGDDGYSGSTLIVHNESAEGKRLGKLLVTLNAKGNVIKHRVGWLFIRRTHAEDEAIRGLLDDFYDAVAANEEFWEEVKPLFASYELESDEANKYVGAARCEPCHRKIHAEWRKTKHADAYATLVRDNKYFYPDCINCHTTGAGYPSGFRIDQTTKHLEGVQCEMCHGPGGKHLAGESPMRMKLDKGFCRECHTVDMSPRFKRHFKGELARVDHSKVPAELRTNKRKFASGGPGSHPSLAGLRKDDPRLFAWLFEELAADCRNSHLLFECGDKPAAEKRTYLDGLLETDRDFDSLMSKMIDRYGEEILTGEDEKTRYRLRRQAVLEALKEAVDEAGHVSVELFVASYGLRAGMAENLLFELRDEVFGDKLEITLRFIARAKSRSGSDGARRFESVNGPREVDEDIRQLLIQKHHPDKLESYLAARNQSIASTDWKECARAAGIDPGEIEQKAVAGEGADLLTEDMRLARSKGVTLSPALLINGVKFVGRLQGPK